MRRWRKCCAACALLGAAAVSAIGLAVMRGSREDEAARAYVSAMLDEAGDRFVILNGVADEQMVREEARRNREAGRAEADSLLLQFRSDDDYRTQTVARVRREWPAETNLWVAAQIGPAVLSDALFVSHPERVYAMTGQSTTPEKWASRWAAMAPHLKSKSRFVPRIRRAFALEGNVLANALQSEGRLKEAWKLHLRVYVEIDPGNASALANLDAMLRRGYRADAGSRRRVELGMAEGDRTDAVSAPSPGWYTLISWNNEMIRAHGCGDIAKAAYIARKILSVPAWRAFVPANAVLGSALAQEGDYVAAEVFFRAALAGKGAAAPQPVVMNDYADTLRHLGRYAEAEAFARRAIAASGGTVPLYKLTLDQILNEAKTNKGNAKEKKT